MAKASGSLASRDLVKFLGFALFLSIPKAPFWPGGVFQTGNVFPVPGLNFQRFPSFAELGVRFVGEKQHKTNSTRIKFIIWEQNEG